jgi:hypothetical protein
MSVAWLIRPGLDGDGPEVCDPEGHIPPAYIRIDFYAWSIRPFYISCDVICYGHEANHVVTSWGSCSTNADTGQKSRGETGSADGQSSSHWTVSPGISLTSAGLPGDLFPIGLFSPGYSASRSATYNCGQVRSITRVFPPFQYRLERMHRSVKNILEPSFGTWTSSAQIGTPCNVIKHSRQPAHGTTTRAFVRIWTLSGVMNQLALTIWMWHTYSWGSKANSVTAMRQLISSI